MTIKWNWGTKIFLVYSGFVVFMLVFVFLCTRQQFDLVAPDYYAQELKYQDVIDGKNNANLLAKGISLSASNDTILVHLPVEELRGGGEIYFYRPDNASLDFKMKFVNNAIIAIPTSKLAKGTYNVKATWTNDSKPYFHELTYTVQ
jgi:hypothetical protein